MLVHWVQLATVLVTSTVTPNLGAPSINPESLIDSGAPAVNPESLIDSEAPAVNHGEGVSTQESRGLFGFGASSRTKPSSSSDFYNTYTLTTTKNGQCVREITIRGKGVDDTFEYPCSASSMSNYVSNDDFLLTGDTPKINSIFGKQPGKLQVIRDGECSVRTYTTANRKTTASSRAVKGAECDAMKEEHAQRLEQWNNWDWDTPKPTNPKKKPNKSPKPSPGNGNSPSDSGSSNLLNMSNINSGWDFGAVPASNNPSTSATQGTPAPNQPNNQLLGALKQLMDYISKAFSRRELLDDPSPINSV